MMKASATHDKPTTTTARRFRLDRRALTLTIITLVVLLGGGFIWYLFQPAPGPIVAAAIPDGSPAPNFTLRTPEGQTYTLSQLRGHPVIINFWATICLPCHQETPLLEQTYQRYRQNGLVILGVDQQEDMNTIRQYGAEYGVTYPLLFDGNMQVSDMYGATPLPRTYFVDARGIVRYVSIGQLSPQVMQKGLQAIGE